MFSVRIVKVDHYLTPPKKGLDECYSEFRGCQLSRVPVVRIFGPTPSGQKTCVHLHGVYPYICVPYDGNTLPVERYMYQLAVCLERALAATGNQSKTAEDLAGVEHIHRVELVFGTPFYGYHKNEQQFLKIYFLNPQFIDRAVELLQSGAIMNRSFQPHEAHVPFILQMFIDYNLHGMNLIKFRKVTFRENRLRLATDNSKDCNCSSRSSVLFGSEPSSSSNLSGHIWDPGSLPSYMITHDNVLKTSNCELEVDVLAVDILNASEVLGTRMNPGIAAIWEDERQRKVQSVDVSNLTPPLSQDRPFAMATKSELFYLEKLKNKLASCHLSSDTSQSHENSGVEVEGCQSFTGTEPKAVTLDSSTLRMSQVSFNAEDREILDILMNMADVQSDGDDDANDRPTSPDDNNAVDENDNRTMSQVIWDVDSDVEPSPNDDSDNDSGILRSPEDEIFLQLDGANDPLDRPSNKGSSKRRRDISTQTLVSPSSTKSPKVQSTSKSPDPSVQDANVLKNAPSALVALRQCRVVLDRLCVGHPSTIKLESYEDRSETLPKSISSAANPAIQEMRPARVTEWKSCRRRSRTQQLELTTRTRESIYSSRDVERRRSISLNERQRKTRVSSNTPPEVNSGSHVYVDKRPAVRSVVNEPTIKIAEVSSFSQSRADDTPQKDVQTTNNPDVDDNTMTIPDSPIIFLPVSSSSSSGCSSPARDPAFRPTSLLRLFSTHRQAPANTKIVKQEPSERSCEQRVRKDLMKMPNSPIVLSSGPSSPISPLIRTSDLHDGREAKNAHASTSTSNPVMSTTDDVVIIELANCDDLERNLSKETSSDIRLLSSAATSTLRNDDAADSVSNEAECYSDPPAELDAPSLWSSKNDGGDKAKSDLLALRRYRVRRLIPTPETNQGEQSCTLKEEPTSLVSTAVDVPAPSTAVPASDHVIDHSSKSFSHVTEVSIRGSIVKVHSRLSDAALSQFGKEAVVVERLFGSCRRDIPSSVAAGKASSKQPLTQRSKGNYKIDPSSEDPPSGLERANVDVIRPESTEEIVDEDWKNVIHQKRNQVSKDSPNKNAQESLPEVEFVVVPDGNIKLSAGLNEVFESAASTINVVLKAATLRSESTTKRLTSRLPNRTSQGPLPEVQRIVAKATGKLGKNADLEKKSSSTSDVEIDETITAVIENAKRQVVRRSRQSPKVLRSEVEHADSKENTKLNLDGPASVNVELKTTTTTTSPAAETTSVIDVPKKKVTQRFRNRIPSEPTNRSREELGLESIVEHKVAKGHNSKRWQNVLHETAASISKIGPTTPAEATMIGDQLCKRAVNESTEVETESVPVKDNSAKLRQNAEFETALSTSNVEQTTTTETSAEMIDDRKKKIISRLCKRIASNRSPQDVLPEVLIAVNAKAKLIDDLKKKVIRRLSERTVNDSRQKRPEVDVGCGKPSQYVEGQTLTALTSELKDRTKTTMSIDDPKKEIIRRLCKRAANRPKLPNKSSQESLPPEVSAVAQVVAVKDCSKLNENVELESSASSTFTVQDNATAKTMDDRKQKIINGLCKRIANKSLNKNPQETHYTNRSAKFSTSRSQKQGPSQKSRSARNKSPQNLPDIGESDEGQEVVVFDNSSSAEPSSKNRPLVQLERLDQKSIDKYLSKPVLTPNTRRRRLKKLLLFKARANSAEWSCRLLKNKSKKSTHRLLSGYPLIHSAPPLESYGTSPAWIDTPFICHSEPHSSVVSDNTQFTTISSECLFSASIGINPCQDTFSGLTSPPDECGDFLWSPASVCLSESNLPTSQASNKQRDQEFDDSMPFPLTCSNDVFDDVMWKLSFLSPAESRSSYSRRSPGPDCSSPTADTAERVLIGRRLSEENPDFLFYGEADEDEDTWRRVLGLPNVRKREEDDDSRGHEDEDDAGKQDRTAWQTGLSLQASCEYYDGNQMELQRNGIDAQAADFPMLDNSLDPTFAQETSIGQPSCCAPSTSLESLRPLTSCDQSVDGNIFQNDETPNVVYALSSEASQFVMDQVDLENPGEEDVTRRRSWSPDLFSPPASVGQLPLTSFGIHFDQDESDERDIIPPTFNCDLAQSSSSCKVFKVSEATIGPSLVEMSHQPSDSFNLEFDSAADQLVDKLVAENVDTQMSDILFLDSADVEMNLEELKSTLDRVAATSPEIYDDAIGLDVSPDCIPPTPENKEEDAGDSRGKNVTYSTITTSGTMLGTPIQSFYTYGSGSQSTSDLSGQRIASNTFEQNSQHEITQPDSSRKKMKKKDVKGAREEIRVLTFGIAAPDPSSIRETLSAYGIPEVRHQSAFCSDLNDVPDRPMEFGQGAASTVIRLRSNVQLDQMPEFASNLSETGLEHWRQVYMIAQESGYVFGQRNANTKVEKRRRWERENFWEPCMLPPNPTDVTCWLAAKTPAADLNQMAPDHGTVCPLAIASKQGLNGSHDVQLHSPDVIVDKCEKPLLTMAFQEDVSPILSLGRDSSSNNNNNDSSRASSKTVPRPTATVYHSTPGEHLVVDRGRHKRSLISAFDESATDAVATASHVRVLTAERNDDASNSSTSVSEEVMVSKRRKRSGRRLSFAPENPSSNILRKTVMHQNAKTLLSPIVEKPQTSQLDGPTPKNAYGFKLSVDSLLLQESNCVHHHQCVTLMSLELHVQTVGDLRPDPAINPIRAIFYHIQHDISEKIAQQQRPRRSTGIIVIGGGVGQSELLTNVTSITNVRDEFELLNELSNVVRDHDPDFLVGYEVQMLSWGFLLERALVLGVKLWANISRCPDDPQNSFRPVQKSGDGFHVNIVGRTVFSLWQLMRHELHLYNYSFENVAYHVLHLRVPLFSFRTLSDWFDDDKDQQPMRRRRLNRWRTIQYYIVRVEGNVTIMDQLNVVGRTGELARLFGIQFWEVHSRGSQFRVESMMLRLTRQNKYVAVSPSAQQRSSMRAFEHLPLILEPVSRFYTDPVVVLDFVSLYPSIIIAYNYCFSTCLGRVENLAEPNPFHFGCTSLKVPAGLVIGLQDRANVSPCGVAFVRQDVRKGILPRMLEEILTTRVMVKMAMKKNKHDRALTRMLDARQLGLKLIANVTYGYTAAHFTGRMPCVEIADSVVSKARETLERAIDLIERTTKWGAKVVYGDTDSVFVLLEGRTKERAFEIGQEMVDAVTADNPKPIKLKLEKVYLPCVLQTKKHYVGFMYETPEQKEPVYDAKGIETVRRDGCPAVAKILEKSLRTLFTTRDVSQVRTYVVHQLQKLMSGRASLQDYVFTREYRGRHGYARVEAPAPAFRLAKQFLRRDPRAEPRQQERVPYVIVYGSPGSLLIDLVRHPNDVLRDSSLRLNAKYYVNNIVIPPLDRALSLVGANVQHWYAFMARNTRFPLPAVDVQRRDTLSRFLVSSDCPICSKPMTRTTMCDDCTADSQMTAIVLADRIREWERRQEHISKVCSNCVGTGDPRMDCVTLDCPVRYRLVQASRDLEQAPYLRRMLNSDELQW